MELLKRLWDGMGWDGTGVRVWDEVDGAEQVGGMELNGTALNANRKECMNLVWAGI